MPSPAMIFATVGTDHHPFDRLIAWVEAFPPAHDAQIECLVQWGTSTQPRRSGGQPYLAYQQMEHAMRAASAVVCHGGPATIMDARRVGRVPIVVPRRADLGEHVDNHQVAFSRQMAELGQVLLAGDQDELHQLLQRALADPDLVTVTHDDTDRAPSVERFAAAVEPLLHPDRQRARRRRLWSTRA